MWFKLFNLLRLPISVFALLGYAATGEFGVWFALGACVFLAVTSIKLVRLRPGALRLAGWLLALEVLGAVIIVGAGEQKLIRQLDVSHLFAWGCVVIVVWVLPNAAILYRALSLFTEPAKEKPGL